MATDAATIQPLQPSNISYNRAEVDMNGAEDGGKIKFTYEVDTNAEYIFNPGGGEVVDLNTGTPERTKMREALYLLLIQRANKGEIDVFEDGDKIIFKTKDGKELAVFTVTDGKIASVKIGEEFKNFRGFVDHVLGNVGSRTSRINLAFKRVAKLPPKVGSAETSPSGVVLTPPPKAQELINSVKAGKTKFYVYGPKEGDLFDGRITDGNFELESDSLAAKWLLFEVLRGRVNVPGLPKKAYF